jgi:hypothetical protein
LWYTSICPICKQELQSVEPTKEKYTQQISESVDDWPLTTQNAESDQSIGSSIFSIHQDSDWICMTSQDSSPSMFSVFTDSECNSVTSKDLGSPAFDVPQDCDWNFMTSEDWSSSVFSVITGSDLNSVTFEDLGSPQDYNWTPVTSQDWSSSVFSAGTDSDCNSVTSDDLGFSVFGIPSDSDRTAVTSQHLKCPKAIQNGETKTCEDLTQDLASHYYGKLDYI